MASATNRSVVRSPVCGAREERAKSTVALVLAPRAVMPAPEPFGRAIEVAPVLVVIGEEPVASQLYRRGEVVLPAAVSAAL